MTHHTDAGSVYTSIAFIVRLTDECVDRSVGNAYDNSMAESQIRRSKSELIHHEEPWQNVDRVETATADRVPWFNTQPIHSSIDDLTPIELEAVDFALTEPLERAG